MEELEIALAVFYASCRTPKGTSVYKVFLEDRRSYSRYGEEWGFFGGKKDPEDKSIESTLKREVREELGIELTRYIYFGCSAWNPTPDVHATEHYYLAELPPQLLKDDEFVTASGGTSKGKLFTFSEARELKLMKTHYEVLNRLEAYLSR